jgi:hypothetical protein
MARIRVDRHSSATFVKWNQVPIGHVIEGRYLGTHQGKFGPLADLETPDGPMALPMPAALARQLVLVKIGALATIQYDGLQPSKKPGAKDYHAFTVFVDDEADILPAPPRRPSGDDGPPF